MKKIFVIIMALLISTQGVYGLSSICLAQSLGNTTNNYNNYTNVTYINYFNQSLNTTDNVAFNGVQTGVVNITSNVGLNFINPAVDPWAFKYDDSIAPGTGVMFNGTAGQYQIKYLYNTFFSVDADDGDAYITGDLDMNDNAIHQVENITSDRYIYMNNVGFWDNWGKLCLGYMVNDGTCSSRLEIVGTSGENPFITVTRWDNSKNSGYAWGEKGDMDFYDLYIPLGTDNLRLQNIREASTVFEVNASNSYMCVGCNNADAQLHVEGTTIFKGDMVTEADVISHNVTTAKAQGETFEYWTDNTGNPVINFTWSETADKSPEIRFGDPENTKIGFPENGYFAFINDYTEMWLGTNGDATLYFNYYVGTNEYHGTATNPQDVQYNVDYFRIYGDATNEFMTFSPSVGGNTMPVDFGANTKGLQFDDNKRLDFGSSRDTLSYWDGSNFIINTTAVSNGLAYFTGNVSAEDYIDRTYIYDKSKGYALDYIKDADEYLNAGEINHSEFYGVVEYQVIDFSKPVIVQEENIINVRGKEVTESFNVTTFPYTKTEYGVSSGKERAMMIQAIYELEERVKVLEDKLKASGG